VGAGTGIASLGGGWQPAVVIASPADPARSWLTPSSAVLLLANLAPLAGVVLLKWDVFPLVLLFWLENVVIGGFNVLKMLFSRTPSPAFWVTKVFVVVFFCFHYGMFCLVHGLFVFMLFGSGRLGGDPRASMSSGLEMALQSHVGWALAALVISHGISFALNFVRAGEYRRTEVAVLMMQPYARILVLHVTLLASGFILVALGSPVGGLVLLVVFKTALDLRAHLRERRKFGSQNLSLGADSTAVQ
jgi:hypothetical protein